MPSAGRCHRFSDSETCHQLSTLLQCRPAPIGNNLPLVCSRPIGGSSEYMTCSALHEFLLFCRLTSLPSLIFPVSSQSSALPVQEEAQYLIIEVCRVMARASVVIPRWAPKNADLIWSIWRHSLPSASAEHRFTRVNSFKLGSDAFRRQDESLH